MDQEKFDKLTKSLSSGSSRRRVLGGAIAALVAGATASVTDAAKKAKTDPKKKAKKDGKKKTIRVQTADGNTVEVEPEQLVPNCNAGSCPNGCCQFTGVGNQGICTTNGSGFGYCVNPNDPAFIPGGACGAGGEVFCSTGCCNAAGTTCTVNGSGAARCGVNGNICAACATGCCTTAGACSTNTQNGNCVNPNAAGFAPGSACAAAVGVTPCTFGCCDPSGTCQGGTTNLTCGAGAQACATCPANQTCLAQSCRPNQGPPPSPPPVPAPAPAPLCPGATSCNGQCVQLSDNNDNCGRCGFACGRRAKCNGGVCKRIRRKKKKKN